MADMNDPLPGSGVKFWTLLAMAAGALLSMRTVVDASPLSRMIAVLSSFVFAFFCAKPVAVMLSVATEDGERAVALVIAFLGVNVLSGLAVFGKRVANDPHGAITWLLSLLPWGRR